MKYWILTLAFLFIGGCELWDTSFKEVSYTIDTTERYAYTSFLNPGGSDRCLVSMRPDGTFNWEKKACHSQSSE